MGSVNDTFLKVDCPSIDIAQPHDVHVNNPSDAVDYIMDKPLCTTAEENWKAQTYIPPEEYELIPWESRRRCDCDGAVIQFKRVRFSGDPFTCCLNGNSGDPNKTCPLIYTDSNNSACTGLVRDFCDQGFNIFLDPRCSNWCNGNDKVCLTKKIELCNNKSGLALQECKDFCKRNPGLCDLGINAYCKDPNNIEDKICACVNSVFTATKYNPLCQDIKCIVDGYSTASMINALGQGCSIIDCSVVYDISKVSGNVQLANIEVKQKCDNESAKTKETDMVLAKLQADDDGFIGLDLGVKSEENKLWWIIGIIGIVGFIGVALVLGYFGVQHFKKPI